VWELRECRDATDATWAPSTEAVAGLAASIVSELERGKLIALDYRRAAELYDKACRGGDARGFG
jgi:hypothetical protein